ncbi:glycoside hydrolase [Lipomyces kononenkoae]|uniref:Glycoside hydrolase n=1 Tax=Lipomyces kononenkoae TaxID=34357 RepID=A0ACC3ST72_LIPKO
MKPNVSGRPPAAAPPVGSSSKLSSESTSSQNKIENGPPDKPVKDINHDLGPAEDTAYPVQYPPVDGSSVDEEAAITQKPEDKDTPKWKPLTLGTYEGTYSPDDHRVDANSVTTPDLPVVENIFKTPRHTQFPIPRLIQMPEDPPISFPKVQGVFASETPEQRAVREDRLNTVREAFIHSWNGYKANAWGHDEVRPVTNGYADPFGGWGASIVDALDTLQIMGLKSELEDAKKFVGSIDFTKSNMHTIPVFETVIRYLGGLISAYDLSNANEPIFLTKAVELADLLVGAFDTPNGMPVLFYDPQLAHRDLKLRAGKHMVFAQFASLSLEFTRLAQVTQNQTYYSIIQRLMDQVESSLSSSAIPGLWPLRMDISGCKTEDNPNGQAVNSHQRSSTPPLQVPKDGPSDSIRPSQELQNKINDAAAEAAVVDEETTPAGQNLVKRQLNLEENRDSQARSTNLGDTTVPDSIVIPSAKPDPNCVGVQGLTESIRDRSARKFSAGALGDSAYEYLIKQHLLLGGTVDQYKSLYATTSSSIKSNLLFRPMVKGDPDILFAGNALIGPGGKITKDYEMTHLSCFLGGMYALGGRALELQDDIKIGAKLADGCYWAYTATRTGIMPENFHVEPCSSDSCHWVDPRERQTPATTQLKKRTLSKRQEGILGMNEDRGQDDATSAFFETPQSNDLFIKTDVQSPKGLANEQPVSEQHGTEYSFTSAADQSTLDISPGQLVGLSNEETHSNIHASGQGATTPAADGPSDDSDVSPAGRGEALIASGDRDRPDVEELSMQAMERTLEYGSDELPRSEINIASSKPRSGPLADFPTRQQMKDAIQATDAGTESTAAELGNDDKHRYDERRRETPVQGNDGVGIGTTEGRSGPVVGDMAEDDQADELVSQRRNRPDVRTASEAADRVAHDNNNGEAEGSADNARDAIKSRDRLTAESASDSRGAGPVDADKPARSVPATQAKREQTPVDEDTDRWEVGGWYDQPRSFVSQDGRYLLRPEALESIFIMYRVTGDKEWQDKGWQMFTAINKYCRTATAYSAISDVTDNSHARHMDEMESFWMAETLKYAYLLFADPSLISLDDYVFNTEAHPFLRPSPVTKAPE